jgi:hypothetical protein
MQWFFFFFFFFVVVLLLLLLLNVSPQPSPQFWNQLDAYYISLVWARLTSSNIHQLSIPSLSSATTSCHGASLVLINPVFCTANEQNKSIIFVNFVVLFSTPRNRLNCLDISRARYPNAVQSSHFYTGNQELLVEKVEGLSRCPTFFQIKSFSFQLRRYHQQRRLHIRCTPSCRDKRRACWRALIY